MNDQEQDPDDEALSKIIGDMDDMESKRVYGDDDKAKGVSITISVAPNGDTQGAEPKEGEEMMSEGGMVEAPAQDFTLPPFMRKKGRGAV